MSRFVNRRSSLAARVSGLVRQVEDAHPGMQEVAIMVYVGDVYVMREQLGLSQDGHWDGAQPQSGLPSEK